MPTPSTLSPRPTYLSEKEGTKTLAMLADLRLTVSVSADMPNPKLSLTTVTPSGRPLATRVMPGTTVPVAIELTMNTFWPLPTEPTTDTGKFTVASVLAGAKPTITVGVKRVTGWFNVTVP